ncbi:hypothetical protein Clacol_007446 [Clathrus columnatus]|uniref:Uncharacterized protein n=1 Tax=Clathrus columnatus TaxID=1419009 RepID=A0AAV5AMP2_9AGAM|nr:hypothetical protein Clacol_007446 [Clathrus columnatus]
MSDQGRESLTDKAKSSMKPESEKSTYEKATDKVKGAYDTVAGKVQPESQKSTTQQATDKVTGKDKSMTESAKDTMGGNGR